MTADRWQQLENVFDAAQGQPPEARAAVIARLCGHDAELRAEALSMLEASDQSGSFLSGTALERLVRGFADAGWSLRPSERVGAYIVDRMLGSGGNGEVWRARDDRLGRDVAIKVLLPHFANDAERLRRFVDEARAAGALNHPNVLAVYDIGDHHGVPFIVSECLEGQSLRQRLDRGPLPLDDAVAVALGIACGLAAAHARGIVHRDLKPDNVFLRSDGGVKILDFGLAKLHLSIDRPDVPPQTMTGGVIGTAGYMAPEQVQGDPVDARADLFALGAILYEMIGGDRAFRGASTVETLHAVLTLEPPSLSTVSRAVPPPLSAIVTRLLRKSPEARFQAAGDLAWALEQVGRAPVDDPSPARAGHGSRGRRWPPVWMTTAALATIAITALAVAPWLRSQVTESQANLAQFIWRLPAGLALDSAPVVSPDSRIIAFVGRDVKGSRLFVRKLDSLEPVEIPRTENAHAPFWSPDSAALGFFAGGKLMKITLAGGAPTVICDAPDGLGGTWSRRGMIVFQPNLIDTGLARVSAAGGSVEPATLLDTGHGENSHRWPVFLPDGVHFLYFARSDIDARRGVYVARADRPAARADRPLFQSDSDAVYAPTSAADGVLFSIARGSLEARRFDAVRLTLVGDARALPFRAGGSTPHRSSMLGASQDVLTFAATAIPHGARLASVDRNGENPQLANERAIQNWPRLSPDGQRLVRQRLAPAAGTPDLWVDDLERGTRVRVTVPPETGRFPVWSPDGHQIAYQSGTDANPHLSIAANDGAGERRQLACPGSFCAPTDWSPDGRLLVVNVLRNGSSDLWSVATDSGVAQPLLAEPYAERDGRISPDGRWIAYVSEEAGRPEVSIRSLSGPPRRIVISADGGDQPVWRRDNQELFFVDLRGRLRSVSVRRIAGGRLAFSVPGELNVPTFAAGHYRTQFDVSPDGQRIYFLRATDDAPPSEITVVTAWRALFK